MPQLIRYMAIAATLAASALASSALANTITFETAPFGAGFTGPVTENGFTYSNLSGGLFVNIFGHPGQDMEGEIVAGGGVLKIVSATGGDFDFNALDYSAFSTLGGSETLQVKGFLSGSLVGTDTYTLANTANTPYTNWTTEAASVLAGKTLSELDIPLNAGNPGQFGQNIDNVVLTPVATPEPGSLALLGAGVLALGWVRRRRKTA